MISRSLRVLTLTALFLGSCGSDDDNTVDTEAPPGTTAPIIADSSTTEATTTEPPTTLKSPTTTEPLPVTETPASTVAETTTAPTGVPAEVVCTPVTVDTGDTTISGERCDPALSHPPLRPAVVVLNGCGGYESDSEITGATVRALAERGVVALRIDYLAAEPAPPDTYCEAGPVVGAVQSLLQAIVDGVATLRADPAVDPDRIGAAAYSLGALAVMGAELGGAGLTSVTRLELTTAALLSYPGQLPSIPAAARDGRLPPLFLMTGENDTVAPPAGARALADAATEGGIPVELVIVPGQDHPWQGEAALTAAAAIGDHLAGQLGA